MSASTTTSFAARRLVAAATKRQSPLALQNLQVRSHHPDPFNPKMTKGWKAALKVRHWILIFRFAEGGTVSLYPVGSFDPVVVY